jgi:hypothetical protein
MAWRARPVSAELRLRALLHGFSLRLLVPLVDLWVFLSVISNGFILAYGFQSLQR